MVERRLGRGLDFLLSGAPELNTGETIQQIPLEAIRPNPFQPRREFPAAELEELAGSIREHGVLQPIVVRAAGEGFEIVAGERRWRACQRVGLAAISALVRKADDTEMLELALIENIQRQDLNPIDEARAYQSYLQRLDLTQEEAARRLGRSRAALANAIRLLDLPLDLQELVSRGTLSMGHARALLALQDAESQRSLAHRIEEEDLSVREVERITRERAVPRPVGAPSAAERSSHIVDLERRLTERLGSQVSIQDKNGHGRIVISYYAVDDLDRILDLLLAAAPVR